MGARRPGTVALVAAAISVAAGCAEALRPSDPMAYVPASAVAAERSDLRQIGGDTTYGGALDPHTLQALAELNLSLATINGVVSYTDSIAGGSGNGVILSGHGLGNHWAAAAHPTRWHSRAGIGIETLTTDLIALGSDAQLDAMRAMTRWSSGFTSRPEFKEVAPIFARNEPMTVAVIWPQSVGDATHAFTTLAAGALGFAGLGAAGGVVQQLGIGRALAVSCRRQGDAMHVNFGVLMSSESTASLVAGGLSLAKGLGAFASGAQAPPGAANLTAMNVDRRGAFLGVAISVPLSEWRAR